VILSPDGRSAWLRNWYGFFSMVLYCEVTPHPLAYSLPVLLNGTVDGFFETLVVCFGFEFRVVRRVPANPPPVNVLPIRDVDASPRFPFYAARNWILHRALIVFCGHPSLAV